MASSEAGEMCSKFDTLKQDARMAMAAVVPNATPCLLFREPLRIAQVKLPVIRTVRTVRECHREVLFRCPANI